MAQTFISYSSADEQYALRLYRYLTQCGITAWFAPFEIAPGQDFARQIGKELGWDSSGDEMKTLSQRVDNLGGAQAVILLLSKNAMESAWVQKEVVSAVSDRKMLLPLQIDHEKLSGTYRFLLKDIQIIQAYRLPNSALEQMKEQLLTVIQPEKPAAIVPQEQITYQQLGIRSITMGDPYYISGETLSFRLVKPCFYLSPPAAGIPEDKQVWAAEHFARADELCGLSPDVIRREIPIPDLWERIEASRERIFRQFLNQENGCYYNNKKYGIYNIHPYGRTEDMSETPVLEIELYTTDYFTHRVIKDVCKALVAEGNSYIENLQYVGLGANRILFTSLGINLLLLDSGFQSDPHTILTSRSTNAAETYEQRQYSVSVIEGVSISDYDPYLKTVNITSAVLRGLQEELGVREHLVKVDTLHFYELFVNRKNLEMGLTCSIELVQSVSVQKDILRMHGKDEMIEIAGKRPVALRDLGQFALLNRAGFLPQALFTVLSYCDCVGENLLDRHHTVAMTAESFVRGKDGRSEICGDAIYQGPHFMAVIDGATPKGERLWGQKPGHIYVAGLLKAAMAELEPAWTAQEAIAFLNGRVGQAYRQHGLDFTALPPEEQLQASIIIYSVFRKEVWSFGDCNLRINTENYYHTKKVDSLLGDLRAFCIEAKRIRDGGATREGEDYGRTAILPYLKEQTLFANTDYAFGYDVINGGPINPKHVKIYAIQSGDHVVLASDGYPKLFDTLAESEGYLHDAVGRDRECMYLLRGTKGVAEGCETFDDRAYLSFVVK